MRAGNLDRVISLQRLTQAVSDAGTVTETWTDFAPGIRAELVAPMLPFAVKAPTIFAGVEADQAYGPAEEVTLAFQVRYVASVTTVDRVVYEGNPYRIIGITEIGRRRGLELRCQWLRS